MSTAIAEIKETTAITSIKETTISPPSTQEVDERALVVLQEVDEVVVVDDESFVVAGECRKRAKGVVAAYEKVFEMTKRAFNAGHKAVCAAEKAACKPMEDAVTTLDTRMLDYKAIKDQQAREEQVRQAEEKRKQEEERRLAEARTLEAMGKKEEAAAVLEKPITVLPDPVPDRTTPKVEGQRFTTLYRFKITDESLIPRAYMIPDEKAIQKVVDALKEKTEIPGVVVVPVEGVAGGKG